MSGGKSGLNLNSFKELKKIGQGGFGEVYSAERDGTKVAIKKIGKKADQSRIREEIATMKHLSHRNIVQFYDAFIDNGETYLVMELCEGGSLASYVDKKGSLDDATAVQILRQLISAVTYIHRENKIHRDISAGNVFIKDATKSKITVKLGDFGLATHIKPGNTACTIVGTPGFIAPQVYNQSYNQAADVYSLGAVLYKMLTGRSPPQTGLPNTDGIYKKNRNAAKLVDRMMDPNAEKRIPLREIVMTEYMKENTDEEVRLYSREHSRDSRRQRSREPIRSRDTLSQERGPLARSASRPTYSGRRSDRLDNDRITREPPSTSHVRISSEHERGRERQRNCGQGLGPSHERNPARQQNWPIRMERLATQRIQTPSGRYIVETNTRCRFEVASAAGIVKRILIVEYYPDQQTQIVYVDPMTNRKLKVRNENDELIELTENPIVYKAESQLPGEIRTNYMSLQKMVVSNIAGRVAKLEYRRPSQFPDGKAQLMENGNLRINCPRGIFVRRKETGEIYSCVNGFSSNKEQVRGSTLTKVKEVYDLLVDFEQFLSKRTPGEISFPFYIVNGTNIAGNPNNSPNSMLPSASQNSRLPFSAISNNQQSLMLRSAPIPTKPNLSRPASSASSNLPRRMSTNENMDPVGAQSKYKFKVDPKTGKVRSCHLSDGRVLRCSTGRTDEFVFTDPSIGSHDQRFKRNGIVPDRATEMLAVLLERIRL